MVQSGFTPARSRNNQYNIDVKRKVAFARMKRLLLSSTVQNKILTPAKI